MLGGGRTFGNIVTCQNREDKTTRKLDGFVKRVKMVLRQNVDHVSWWLQIVCDKILKERDQKIAG